MRLHRKIALAGIVSTTAIGLANMNEHVNAQTHNVTPDSQVILNKHTDGTSIKEICSNIVQFPLGGK